MLATLLADPTRIAGCDLIAEPKLDGQRAQLHIRAGRTAHLCSRPGRELLGHAGFAWLRDLRWPVDDAVLDGEVVAGDGHEGIQSVFEHRWRAGSAMAFVAFDVLHVDGQDLKREPWTHRRKRLEDIFSGPALPSLTIVPTTEDAPGSGIFGSAKAAARDRAEEPALGLPPWAADAGLAEGEAQARARGTA